MLASTDRDSFAVPDSATGVTRRRSARGSCADFSTAAQARYRETVARNARFLQIPSRADPQVVYRRVYRCGAFPHDGGDAAAGKSDKFPVISLNRFRG